MSTYKIDNTPYYAYSYRVDMNPVDADELVEFMNNLKHSPEFYIFSFENGKKTDKVHLQGALFFKEKVADTQAYRNVRTMKFVSKTKQPVSFKIARKASSLAKYCNNKEGKGFKTNLSPLKIKQLGTWKDNIQTKKDLKEQYFNHMKTFEIYENPNLQFDSDIAREVKIQIISEALEHVWTSDVDHRPPPITTLLYIARKAGAINNKLFLRTFYHI